MAPPRLGAGALLVLAALVRAAPTTTTASVSSTTATPPTAPAGRQQPADEDAEPHLILSVRDHALCNGLRCKEGNGGPKPACGIWDTNKYFLFDSLCDMLYFSCMTERSYALVEAGACGYDATPGPPSSSGAWSTTAAANPPSTNATLPPPSSLSTSPSTTPAASASTSPSTPLPVTTASSSRPATTRPWWGNPTESPTPSHLKTTQDYDYDFPMFLTHPPYPDDD